MESMSPAPVRAPERNPPLFNALAALAGVAFGATGVAWDLFARPGLALALFTLGTLLFIVCGRLRPDRRPVLAWSTLGIALVIALGHLAW